MTIERDEARMEIVVTERLSLDARRGQEARMIGAARLRGARGRVLWEQARVADVAWLRARVAA